MICGYSENIAKNGKKPKAGKLGTYMQEYPSMHPVTSGQFKNVSVTYVPKHVCKHRQDTLSIGQFKVMLSEFPEPNWDRVKPDLGIYMAEPWLSKAGRVVTNWVQLDTGTSYGVIYIRWPDRDVVDLEVLVPVIARAIEYLESGKLVEIGCFGGHGRTGTVAACLLGIIEGISGEEAVEEVRTRYCEHAVEGKVQEKFVAEFCDKFRTYFV